MKKKQPKKSLKALASLFVLHPIRFFETIKIKFSYWKAVLIMYASISIFTIIALSITGIVISSQTFTIQMAQGEFVRATYSVLYYTLFIALVYGLCRVMGGVSKFKEVYCTLAYFIIPISYGLLIVTSTISMIIIALFPSSYIAVWLVPNVLFLILVLYASFLTIISFSSICNIAKWKVTISFIICSLLYYFLLIFGKAFFQIFFSRFFMW